MYRSLKIILFILLGVIAHLKLSAQTNGGIEVPNVLPPSPTASELGKFALIGNSFSAGSANSHIELYNYKTKNLSVPVSIDYNANGLKVDMISSRTGMNWMLSAGGVISRTINGAPDDVATFAEVPSDFPQTRGDNLLGFINAVIMGQDTQPDVFTFSFERYSGRFIIFNNTIKKMEQNNLKITGDLNDGFIITTPDGVKYTFDKVEGSLSIASGNPFYKVRNNNAWFLTNITHPKGDIIWFSYANCEFTYVASKSNSYVFYEGNDGSCANGCGNISTQEIITQLRNFGVYLTGISSNFQSAGSLIFNYNPRTDVSGDVRLSSINYKDNTNQTIKTTSFNYTEARDRFFLETLMHGDQKYMFDYYSLASLPARLSYGQDHNGYYNGKDNNSSMIPTPADPRYVTAFSSRGFGERRPDPNFSKIGMLRKINYPTCGSDSLVYEGNAVYTNDTADCANPFSASTIQVSGSSEFKQQSLYYSNQFHVTCGQNIFINIGCNANTHAADGSPIYPNGEYLTSAQIRNDDTGAIINVVVQAGADQHKTSNTEFLAPGNYTVILKVRGDAGGSMSVKITNAEEFNGSRKIPGLRLKKVVSYDPIGQNISVKNFYYTNLTTNKSSGIAYRAIPSYDSRIDRYIQCSSPEHGPIFSSQICTYTKLSSTPNFGLSNLSGNHIYYSEVTEGYGENFENGGVQHKFDIYMDAYPAMIAGYSLYGSPISNSGVQGQSLETLQRTFKKVNDVIIPIKEVITHYKNDTRLSEIKTFFAVTVESSAQVANTTLPSNPSLNDLRGINVDQYDVVSKWIYADTVKTVDYDNAGANPVVSTRVFEYNNISHQLVNSEKSFASNGKINRTEYTYPQDNISGLTPIAETARQQLITDYNISALLEETDFVGNTLIGKKRTNFKKWTSTLTAPETIDLYDQNLLLQQQLNFYKYDNFGNVLSHGLAKGPASSYIWSYGGFYPIAEIRNIDYQSVENALGASNIASFSNTYPDKVAIDNFLTPLKAAFPNSLITTSAFKPLTGLTSSTDPKGMTTSYEYDSFQRLKNIKDQNGNVVKNYDYHYKP